MGTLRVRRTTAVSIVGAIVLVSIVALFASRAQRAYEYTRCNVSYSDVEQKINCWIGILKGEIKTGGAPRAMSAFAELYNRYPDFANNHCHFNAHLVGDEAYRQLIVQSGRIDTTTLSPDATSCFFGFFVGLLEHYFQNDPNPTRTVAACKNFDKSYGYLSGYIRPLCFHAAGHGFLLATVGSHPTSEKDQLSHMVDDALVQCAHITGASVDDTTDCNTGAIFNAFEFQTGGITVLAENLERYLQVCRQRKADTQNLCFEILGQKAGLVFHGNVGRLAEFTAMFPSPTNERSFTNGIDAAMRYVYPERSYDALFSSCAVLGQSYSLDCMVGAVRGLFELGPPQEEYREALHVCALMKYDASLQNTCYHTISVELHRYYSESKTLQICRLLPTEFTESCRKNASEPVPSYFRL